MKKLKLLFFILMIGLANIVYAENEVTMKIVNCTGTEISGSGSIACDITIEYDELADITVNKVSFTHDTKLNLAFEGGRNITPTINNKQVELTSSRATIASGDTIAKMTITAPSTLATGTYPINFTAIKASNKNDAEELYDCKTIVKTISYKAPADLTLKSISIDGKNIDGFSPSKLEYNITVSKETIQIDAVRNNESTLVSGLGQVRVDKTNVLVREIKVSKEGEPSPKIYTLNITYKEDNRSSDNTLKTLELYDGTELLDFTYDNKKTSFTYNVLDLEKVSIKATLNNSKASFVNKYGPRDVTLKYGQNKVEIKVKAENESIKTYTLNLTREDSRSADATLSSLQVGDINVSLLKDVYEYNVDVKYNVLNSNLKATTTSDKASVAFQDIELVNGQNPPIVITVTSEKGTKQEYKLTINRLSEEESKIVLESITVTNHDIHFDKQKNSYDLDLAKDENTLDIIVKPDTVTKEILGNKDLKNDSEVVIKVKDDDGEKTYTLKIHKEEKSSLELLCYAIFGFGVLMILLSIMYAIKKKKK